MDKKAGADTTWGSKHEASLYSSSLSIWYLMLPQN